jgi:hypothetical protein
LKYSNFSDFYELNLFLSSKKFFSEITFFQVAFSIFFLVSQAIFHHFLLAIFTSSNHLLSSALIISVAVASHNIHKTNSKFDILSFRDSFFNHLKALYSFVVIPDHSFKISFVKIAYSIHSFIHLSCHSPVSSFLISIDLNL